MLKKWNRIEAWSGAYSKANASVYATIGGTVLQIIVLGKSDRKALDQANVSLSEE